MKKTLKISLVSALILSLLLTLGGCARKQEPAEKYNDLIEDFVPDSFNMKELAVGEVDKPNAAVWTQANVLDLVKVVSTDENVVTVSKGGKVTAIAEGSAYVIFAIEIPFLGTVMSEIYRYDVCATIWDKYARDFVPDWHNTVTLEPGQQNTPTSAVWLRGGGQAYSSDENVVTVDAEGKVTAVGAGEAYVVYVGVTDMHETYLFIVIDESTAAIPEQTEVAHDHETGESDEIDFDKYISEYESNFFNSTTLTVGQEHTPGAAVWVRSGGKAYSSDESVVTVDSDGNVTAVGTGIAYVVCIAQTDMYQTFRYVVH